MRQPAILALQDGTLLEGQSIGMAGRAAGEVVFNTAMTGYQEILTDPSYARQIITLTCPHVGNTGINAQDMESARVVAAGLVIRDLPAVYSNWRSGQSLDAFLGEQGVVAIAGIDTRRLTRLLRERGAQHGCILAAEQPDAAAALAQARAFPGLIGMDLAREVTTGAAYDWEEGVWQPGSGYRRAEQGPCQVVVYDFGVKRAILRMLAERGCRVHVVPATTPAERVLAMAPHGVFLSNGPGDPQPCDYAIAAIRKLLAADMPLFGICLGHQLLALACGARTSKMKFGHHGANHPVQEVIGRQVLITSQNHSFAVDDRDLPAQLEVTHRSLFDDTIQGLRHRERPAFSFQGHPEASPGPHDVGGLFDRFVELMDRQRARGGTLGQRAG